MKLDSRWYSWLMIVDSANQNAQVQCFKIISVYGSAVSDEDNNLQMGQNLRNESFISGVLYLDGIQSGTWLSLQWICICVFEYFAYSKTPRK